MTAAEKEYGGALYSLAVDEHLEDTLLAGLDAALAAFRENPSYPKLLQNPAIQKEERLALLDAAFRTSVHAYVVNFLKILCEKSALNMLKGCADEFRALLFDARGILPVTAISATALTEQQIAALKEKLAAKTGKTIALTNIVDEKILGGVKISYAGKELDGSVAGKLASIRNALMA